MMLFKIKLNLTKARIQQRLLAALPLQQQSSSLFILEKRNSQGVDRNFKDRNGNIEIYSYFFLFVKQVGQYMNRPPYSLWQSGGACPDIRISKND